MGCLNMTSNTHGSVCCPICNNQVSLLPAGQLQELRRCPICKSLDRQRALWLYFERHTDLFTTDNEIKVLHFAPEKVFHDKFTNLSHVDYYPVDFDADRYKGNLRDVVDIQKIQYQDNMFDAIICFHVLEHAPDEQAAMSELRRVLKPDGQGLISVPVFYKLETTLENPAYDTPELRQQYYGQHDHVRKYGRDFICRLRSAGFTVDTIKPVTAFTDKNYGLRKTQEIFIVKK